MAACAARVRSKRAAPAAGARPSAHSRRGALRLGRSCCPPAPAAAAASWLAMSSPEAGESGKEDWWWWCWRVCVGGGGGVRCTRRLQHSRWACGRLSGRPPQCNKPPCNDAPQAPSWRCWAGCPVTAGRPLGRAHDALRDVPSTRRELSRLPPSSGWSRHRAPTRREAYAVVDVARDDKAVVAHHRFVVLVRAAVADAGLGARGDVLPAAAVQGSRAPRSITC